MPKMLILSGKQEGAVVEMSLLEAQTAYCTGFAEMAPETEKPQPKPRLAKPEPKPKEKKKGA